MMPATYVRTDDLLFVGETFPAHWQECLSARTVYAYIIPEPSDPQWPDVLCYFSQQPFTRRELRQLCQGDETPLAEREQDGEPRCGFRWPLDTLKLEALTAEGEAVLAAVGYGQEGRV